MNQFKTFFLMLVLTVLFILVGTAIGDCAGGCGAPLGGCGSTSLRGKSGLAWAGDCPVAGDDAEFAVCCAFVLNGNRREAVITQCHRRINHPEISSLPSFGLFEKHRFSGGSSGGT